MSILFKEIHEQPAAIERAMSTTRTTAEALVDDIRKRDIRMVILAARGTSDNAATYAKYLWQITCGIPAGLAAPSVHTLYEARVDYRNALVVGVSQSGAGEDVNEVVAQARKAGALTAAITNTPGSAIAGIAEHVLNCDAGPEKAVAATKTYTTSLALLALVGALWSGNRDLAEALARVPGVAQTLLTALPGTVEPLASTLIHAQRLVSVARGLLLPTAVEASLKIAETSYTATQAFSSADLLHGPIASVPAQTPCLLFAPNGRTEESMRALGEKLRGRGARVLEVSTNPGAALPLADPGTELLSPIVDILPAQLLAYHLTVARGYDPDNPAGLSKVTVTR